ncbi:Crp/Fnr family transcriptional regulator [Sulfuriflexus mobilis]|uniref:Crp/Fnr family transcriptional regulator n=1 Tax=Sulfuriflexus mobilis TaxID=1811807 RepID=UPI000F83ABA8|nr:Crp/Fnr family transcriptional regulator [Sulfuriflexus mobilis]
MASVKNSLLEILAQLSRDEQAALLDYAEFMLSRSEHAKTLSIREPVDIPRPEQETVLAAMRRLSDTYPMLNKDKILHEAAGLMSAHVMQGREAHMVIDDLQVLFHRHYEILIEQK